MLGHRAAWAAPHGNGAQPLLTGSWFVWAALAALQLGTASQVAPVDKASLVLVALLAFLFLGERPSGREWADLLLVAAGVLVLAFMR